MKTIQMKQRKKTSQKMTIFDILSHITTYRKSFFVACCIIGITSCSMDHPYLKPRLSLPSQWHSSADHVSTEPYKSNLNWWENFNDPQLSELLKIAKKNNLDIKIAKERIIASRESESREHANLFPNINLEAPFSRGNPGYYSFNKRIDITQATLDAGWEVDIFGKNRHELNASHATYLKTAEEARGVMISLLSEVSYQYTRYRSLEKQIEIVKENSRSAKLINELTRALSQSGIADGYETATSEAIYQQQLAQLPALESELISTKNRITNLLGLYPGKLDNKLSHPGSIPWVHKKIILDTPAVVIENRPDVRAAEQALIAATEKHRSSIARQYPNLTLSGYYGPQHTNLLPELYIWQLAENVTLPLIDFKRIQSQINLSHSDEKIAYYQYYQTVNDALTEVESAVKSYQSANTRYDKLNAAALNAKLALRLATERYRKGISNYLEALEAQRVYYSADLDRINAQTETTQSAIKLYKSLGGLEIEANAILIKSGENKVRASS